MLAGTISKSMNCALTNRAFATLIPVSRTHGRDPIRDRKKKRLETNTRLRHMNSRTTFQGPCEPRVRITVERLRARPQISLTAQITRGCPLTCGCGARDDSRLPIRSTKDFVLTSFHDLGLAESIVRALAEEKYVTPAPIRLRSENPAGSGNNCACQSFDRAPGWMLTKFDSSSS